MSPPYFPTTASTVPVPSSPQDDDVLVARAREGDHAAFRELVTRYEGLVAATVFGMLGRGAEAQDVGQQVFVRFYEALGQYRGAGALAPYLSRIAVNLSLNALKRRKRQQRRLVSRDADGYVLREPSGGGEPTIARRERITLVREAVLRLRPKHRAVVVLRLIRGYSTRETADILGVPQGTVLSRLHRAQAQLKDMLHPYLFEDDGT